MKKWNAAAYLRLSSDDGDKLESNSIVNQKSIVKMYEKQNNDIKIVDYYIDDGYSGTNFERPEFTRLINDIKNNKINAIIVKDLSRLGRNYIEVGNYLEQFFPNNNVRFIAINDNVDSYKDPKSVNNVIVPFKNLMNDEYARDISNKVRSVLDNKKINGQFIGSVAPYGYLKDPNDKHKFIIDKKAGKVVKKIFSMILNGKSKKDVVNELNKLNIATPSAYKTEEEIYTYNLKDKTKKWDTRKLDDILKNQTYIGDLIQGKKRKISHKIHKTLRVSSNNWVVVHNHHKPLVSADDFDKVQEILYERTIKVKNNNNYDLFAGHLRCNECGGNLVLRQSKGYEYYYCSNFVYKKTCTRHSCNKKIIEQNVIDTINSQKKIIEDIDKQINEIINREEIDFDVEILKVKIEANDKKIEKYIMLKDGIKADLQDGFITEDEYWEYSSEYSKKINKLQKENKELKEKLNKEQICIEENNKEWIEKFKKIDDIEKLNKPLVDELIEDIVVDENSNIKIIFKSEDKYFEALDFINKHKCDIMSTSKTAS